MLQGEQAAEKAIRVIALVCFAIRVRARVFVFVRSSRSRLHGHDHEDFEMPLSLFEQPASSDYLYFE